MSGLRRVGAGDALIALAVIALILAALLPTYRARDFARTVEEAVVDVEALRAAALRLVSARGEWPDARPPGRVPAGATGAFDNDTTMVREAYTLEWRLFDRIRYVEAAGPPPRSGAFFDDDEVPAPEQSPSVDPVPDSVAPELVPTVRREGAVVVHSPDELLLAQLLRRFGPERSFVRDTTWTLIVPRS